MHIGALNVRLTFERHNTVTDAIGNHLSSWEPYFVCWATASKGARSADEMGDAVTEENGRLDFTVRWCPEVERVTSNGYRIRLTEKAWNIISIDEMGFHHRSRKFQCLLDQG